MKKPFDCDCIIEELDVADRRMFILNTTPRETLVHYGSLTACPVCQDERKGPAAPWSESEKVKRMKRPLDSKDAAVLKLFVDDDCARLRLDHKSYDCDVNIQWTLTPDGAYLPCEYGWKPSSLVMGLRNLAIVMGLEPTDVDDLPQTDQPVLYLKTDGVPCLRFKDDSHVLWPDGKATLAMAGVDLVSILYSAAKRAEPPAEEPSVIVLDLFENNHDEVILLLRHRRQVAVWVLRPDGAYDAGQDCGPPVNLAAALRDYTRELEPMTDALPQTDQPVLYMSAPGMPCLLFRGDVFALWESRAMWMRDEKKQSFADVETDLVALLYNAAKRDAPPDEKESGAIVLKLYFDIDDRVCLRLRIRDSGPSALWVLRSDGAHWLNDASELEPCDLVTALLGHARHLEPTDMDDLPQTNQPVLYLSKLTGSPRLRFMGDTFCLGENRMAIQTNGTVVDMVSILYKAATAKPPDEKPGAIVLDLFLDQYDKVRLRLDCKGHDDIPWLLEPDGAYLPVEYGRERFDLPLALRGYASHLEPTAVVNLPQTDQPVLYKSRVSGMPCLRFDGDSHILGADGAAILTNGLVVNLVSILYKAAKPTEHPDEKPGVIVLGLQQDTYGEVCLRLHTENNKATWVLRQPHGARWLNDDGALEPCDLVAELCKHARHLEATAACDFPQTDRPVLFMSLAGVPSLRFMGDVYNLWESGKATLAGSKVDLVALLYAAATAEPPNEKPLDTPAAQALRLRISSHLTLATVFRPICIVWNDATPYHGWHNLGDGDRLPLETMETMGYLVGETPAAIVVARSVSAHKARDLLVIPRSAIVKMETMN